MAFIHNKCIAIVVVDTPLVTKGVCRIPQMSNCVGAAMYVLEQVRKCIYVGTKYHTVLRYYNDQYIVQ